MNDMHDLHGKVALVTGASRGIGAKIALLLAERGADVVVNYRSKQPRAAEVAAAIEAVGSRAILAQADLTNAPDLVRMAQLLRAHLSQIDVLVLNASGGLEKDKPATYARLLNRDAQVQTLEHHLPFIPNGGTVVFVTSHWAHFYGQKPVSPAYEPIAASKHAGEEALRVYIPHLARYGIRLIIVSGDMIDGTITPRLLERSLPGLLAARRLQAGRLPTVAEFAEAIVKSIADPSLPSGATVFVGSTE